MVDFDSKYLRLTYTFTVAMGLWLYSIIWNVIKLFVPYGYRSKKIEGEIVLVTGAGSGLGRLLALKLAKQKARLVLIDVNKEANEETAKEIIQKGGNANAFTCDLSNKEEIYRVAEEIKKSVGDVQILINNAGIVSGKKFLDSGDSLIEKTFRVNTMAHFWLVKAFLPNMMENNHGHIVSIASIAGIFGTPGLCDYCASKFAVVGFEESLRNELVHTGKTGVKTTLVCPYYINTGMFKGTKSEYIPFLDAEYVTDKIEEAILTNQKTLFLPRIMYLFYFLKGIIPIEVEQYIASYGLRTNFAMDTFEGRKTK